MPVASGRFGDDAAVGGSLALVHAVCFLLHVSCNVACCIGVPRYVTSGAISGPIVPLDLRTMCVTIAVLTKHRNRRPGHVTLCQAEPAWAVLQRACCMFVGCTPEGTICASWVLAGPLDTPSEPSAQLVPHQCSQAALV
jgi:hypothetical protein